MRLLPHSRAILQAFLVTFLWSTSWILIKYALEEIPPITFAGLRYTFATLILLPGLKKHKVAVRALSPKNWRNLAVLGVVFYALTQGGVFVSLKYLESVTFSLLLNFTTLFVAITAMVTLKEIPTWKQWGGITIFIAGVWIYFYPPHIPEGGLIGLAFGGLTVCANAGAAIIGRSVNKGNSIPPIVITVISMGIGAVLLLGFGLTFQGLPLISARGWGTIVWLAFVNTAFAFTLWNKTLQTLTAVQSSIINNTMLIQIAVLAWIFLGEQITPGEIGGLLLVIVGTLIVQLTRSKE